MTADQHMVEQFDLQRTVHTSPERAWALVSDFAHLANWNPAVTDCRIDGDGIGAIRTIRATDGNEVREQLVELDHESRRLRYRLLPLAHLPVTTLDGTITIHDGRDGRARVSWSYSAPDEPTSAELTEFNAALASRTIRRIRDLESAATTHDTEALGPHQDNSA